MWLHRLCQIANMRYGTRKVYSKTTPQRRDWSLHEDVDGKMPWLPVEEDGRLNDPVLKENFITRIYCLNDFYESMAGEPTRGKIIDFHSRYKLTLMAHHPESYRSLGRLVADVANYEIDEFYREYRLGLMTALSNRASRKNNTNVLMHLQGISNAL